MVVNGLDREAVIAAVRAAAPEVIVHEMTALASLRRLREVDREFAATNELRTRGTDNLLAAAVQAGTRRVIAQGYAGAAPDKPSGGRLKTEADPLDWQPHPGGGGDAQGDHICGQGGAAGRAGGQARGSAPSPARRAEGEELARRFFETADGGDMGALLGMLAPNVVLHADGGGKAQAISAPLHGREGVARLLAGLFRRGRHLGTSVRLAWVNGQPGAVGYDAQGRVFTVFELEVADGVVQAIRAVVNRDKLRHIGPVSDVARTPAPLPPPSAPLT